MGRERRNLAALGESLVKALSDRGSTPLISTTKENPAVRQGFLLLAGEKDESKFIPGRVTPLISTNKNTARWGGIFIGFARESKRILILHER